jgi:hypothetical protein
MNSKNKGITNKPHMEDDLVLPGIEFSIYDITLKRLDILECK